MEDFFLLKEGIKGCYHWSLLHFPSQMSLINLASILIVYNYCVPVQMVMQMAMGAVQVCVNLLLLNRAICITGQ